VTGAIDDLALLVPPPATPVDRDGDWSAVEAALGLHLPEDFKALVRRYGLGEFDDITLLTPFDTHTGGVLDLVERARDLLNQFDQPRDEWPEDFPYPLYPETNGLLEWASTTEGSSLYWLTDGEADRWPVVVWDMRRGAQRFDLGAVDFLHGYLSSRFEVELLRAPPAVPWFDPYRKRVEVYVQLSDGDLPYLEQLRVLREVLAPTADRGNWEGFGQRQDYFKAVDRDGLLTYQNIAGHEIKVEFPPEDEDQARTVILEASRAMGCRVLGATRNGEPTGSPGG
jgi:hypothetical protein